MIRFIPLQYLSVPYHYIIPIEIIVLIIYVSLFKLYQKRRKRHLPANIDTWDDMMMIAETFPKYNPSLLSQQSTLKKLYYIAENLTCELCQRHFKHAIFPGGTREPDLSSRENFQRWIVNMHNIVRIAQKKTVMSYPHWLQYERSHVIRRINWRNLKTGLYHCLVICMLSLSTFYVVYSMFK